MNNPDNNRSGIMGRRTFLKTAGAAALNLVLNACMPKQPNAKEVFSGKWEEIEAIVDYQKAHQYIQFGIDSNGNKYVTNCNEPKLPENGNSGGFIHVTAENFDWSGIPLTEISVNGSTYPLLTSGTLGEETINFLNNWYQRGQVFIEEEIKRLNLPDVEHTPIRSLVVHYKSTRNSAYEMREGKCEMVLNNEPQIRPTDIHNQLIDAIRGSTDGVINYETADMLTITEQEMPLISDINLTFQGLIDAYGSTINYEELGKLAVKNNTSVIFVYAGASAGMNESAVWTDKVSGKKIIIFGLNYDRGPECAFESWVHFLEYLLEDSSMKDLYLKYTGRLVDDNLPFLSEEQNLKNYREMNNGKIYAAVGIGTAHFPPNSVYSYDYGSLIPYIMPGQLTPIDSNVWNGNQFDYYCWWLKSLPREFLDVITP